MEQIRTTLLLPPLSRFAGTSGTLARWLARGDSAETIVPGRESALRAVFEFIGTSLPVAALTHSVDVGERENVVWLRCDPAYLIADAVTLRLMACGDIGQSADDAQQFGAALKPLFGDAGYTLEIARADRWYLRCARESRLPKFSAPEEALGDDFARHLPEGENAQRWRSLLNEAQITLTQHPLNARRIGRGLPPINSVWIWGAGALPDWVRCEFGEIYTDDDVAKALARAAHMHPAKGSVAASKVTLPRLASLSDSVAKASLASGASDAQPAARLFDLANLRDIAALERDWFDPLAVALKRKRISQLKLRFESGECVIIEAAHRWRVWRRIKPIA